MSVMNGIAQMALRAARLYFSKSALELLDLRVLLYPTVMKKMLLLLVVLVFGVIVGLASILFSTRQAALDQRIFRASCR